MKRSPMPRRLAPLERRTPSGRGRPLAKRGLWLCWAGHRWITEHPADAVANGWSMRDDGYRGADR